MGSCLVTKLKESVDNNSLDIFGALKMVVVQRDASKDAIYRRIIIGAMSGERIKIKLVGGSLYTDEDCTNVAASVNQITELPESVFNYYIKLNETVTIFILDYVDKLYKIGSYATATVDINKMNKCSVLSEMNFRFAGANVTGNLLELIYGVGTNRKKLNSLLYTFNWSTISSGMIYGNELLQSKGIESINFSNSDGSSFADGRYICYKRNVENETYEPVLYYNPVTKVWSES